MAGGATFEPDRDGIAELLRSPDMAAAVGEAANTVAAELRDRGVTDIYMDPYVSDRAGVIVTIAQTNSEELVNGLLIDAATAAQLDVRAYGA